jgi:hypothetical protein
MILLPTDDDDINYLELPAGSARVSPLQDTIISGALVFSVQG